MVLGVIVPIVTVPVGGEVSPPLDIGATSPPVAQPNHEMYTVFPAPPWFHIPADISALLSMLLSITVVVHGSGSGEPSGQTFNESDEPFILNRCQNHVFSVAIGSTVLSTVEVAVAPANFRMLAVELDPPR